MRRALDTNVLVRLLTQDDPSQFARSHRLLRSAAHRGERLFISDIVIAELIWTLKSSYRFKRDALINSLHFLVNHSTFQLQSESALREAIQIFESASLEFSDCLIFAVSRLQGCNFLVTFDKRLASLPGVINLGAGY